jgi:hypothetical protein
MTSYLTDAGMIIISPPVASKIFRAKSPKLQNPQGPSGDFVVVGRQSGERKRGRTLLRPLNENYAQIVAVNTVIGCGAQTNAIQHTRNTAFASQRQ